MRIGLRITITQVENDMIHDLFEIYDILDLKGCIDSHIKGALENAKYKAKNLMREVMKNETNL